MGMMITMAITMTLIMTKGIMMSCEHRTGRDISPGGGVGEFWFRHNNIYLVPLKALQYSHDFRSLAVNWQSS